MEKTDYWIKDITRKEIITKNKIPNKSKFSLFANYFNLIDEKGLLFQLNEEKSVEMDRLFSKNGFYYYILQADNFREFFVLPNKTKH